jgi:predicted Zn-dependent peptidase
VVSIAGKFEEEEIVNLMEEKLCNLKGAKEKKTYNPVSYSPGYRVKVKDIEQAHICLATRGVKLNDEKYYAFAVLNNILGGSMGARLFQSIREEKGLAYSVYSSSSSFVDMGIFSIYAAVSHEKVKDTILAVKEELSKLKQDGVTVDELNTAKEQIKGSYIFSLENVNGRMFANGKNMTLLGKFYLPEEVIAGVDKVTMDDIEEVSLLINDVEDYTGVLITNRRADLKKWIQG